MIDCFSDTYGNPHSDEHSAGWAAAGAIEGARTRIANRLGADEHEIVFTSGATEANNLALLGCRVQGGRNRILVAASEHKSILASARELSARGLEVEILPVTRQGVVEEEALERSVDDRTLMVSLQFANNEIGTVQPLPELAEICRSRGALVHSDGAQGLSWARLDVNTLGVDLMSLSGHKAGGPKGVGALFVRAAIRGSVQPLFFGGEQEGGLRPGTLPTPLCVGLGLACELMPVAAEIEAWRAVTSRLLEGLREIRPDLALNGHPIERHPGNLSIRLPGCDADQVIARLQPNVAVSRGSACTSGTPEPSHVLRAIGLNARECGETIRLSTGRTTSAEDVDRSLHWFRKALHFA